MITFYYGSVFQLCKFQVELDPSLTETGDGDEAGGKYVAHSIIFYRTFLTVV